MSIRLKITLAAVASISVATTIPASAENVSAECRGVAAGVVAAMRAGDELATDSEVAVAIVAARRACGAALQDLVHGRGDAPAAAAGAAVEDAEEDKEPSIWDLLTRDRELKPGNERLRRLKTQ